MLGDLPVKVRKALQRLRGVRRGIRFGATCGAAWRATCGATCGATWGATCGATWGATWGAAWALGRSAWLNGLQPFVDGESRHPEFPYSGSNATPAPGPIHTFYMTKNLIPLGLAVALAC